MQKKNIAILVVIYNGRAYIKDCLQSLKQQTYHDFDIIIVDNASTDDSLSIIRQEYTDAVILSAPSNLGYAGGNNLGLKYILDNEYQYVLLINEDTIADNKLLEVLLSYANEMTAVAPIMYKDRQRKKKWYYGGEMDMQKGKSSNISPQPIINAREVTFITGCCILLHTNILRKIGLFDEKYYLYYEDDDLSMRMLNNGIKMLNVAETWLWHRVQHRQASGYYMYYMTRNQLYFQHKYSTFFEASPFKTIIQLVRRYWIVANPEDLKYRKYVGMGIMDYLFKNMYKKEWNPKW
jgi:Predicted glycosyltransferases